MRTITIQTNRSNAVDEWEMKEYGSWEDHDKDMNHPCALLQKFGGKLTLTEDQANKLIVSGIFQSTGWDDDDIDGGARTKRVIANWVKKIKAKLDK